MAENTVQLDVSLPHWPKFFIFIEAPKSSGVFAYKWHDSLLSCDYSNTHFDWSSLRNRYVSEPYTQDEADAVAGLMLACGIGTETNFENKVAPTSVV